MLTRFGFSARTGNLGGVLLRTLLGLVLTLSTGTAANGNRNLQKEVEAALMCQCGCSMTVANCTHTDCGFSVPERKRMAQMVADGKSAEEIVQFYIAQYGRQILSTPPKSDLMAWVTPIIMGLAALTVLILYLRERPKEEQKPPPKTKKLPYDDIIERELKEME